MVWEEEKTERAQAIYLNTLTLLYSAPNQRSTFLTHAFRFRPSLDPSLVLISSVQKEHTSLLHETGSIPERCQCVWMRVRGRLRC